MYWSEATDALIQELKPTEISPVLKKKLISVIDLTSLQPNDTEADMLALFEKANSVFGHVASVCIPPTFVRLAKSEFAGSPIHVATVANFPEGNSSLETVLLEINRSLEDGADEIDMVFPYHRYLAGERKSVQQFIAECKAACGDKTILKVILETGALVDLAIIADASFDVLTAGADFIKTSTGKMHPGATLAAAATMLLVIKHASSKLPHTLGVKISGGLKNISEAAEYLALAERIMGADWATKETFRIGTSKLVDEIIKN